MEKTFQCLLPFSQHNVFEIYAVVWVVHTFLMLSNTLQLVNPCTNDGCLGWFQYLFINEATVKIHMCFCRHVFITPGLRLELYCKYMLNFLRNSQIGKVIIPFYTPTHNIGAFQWLHILTNFWYYQSFELQLLQWVELISHCDLNLHFHKE